MDKSKPNAQTNGGGCQPLFTSEVQTAMEQGCVQLDHMLPVIQTLLGIPEASLTGSALLSCLHTPRPLADIFNN